MKQLILLAVFSAVALAAKDYDAMFREFKATHLKAYANEAEEAQRFKNFVANMRKAEVLQAANPIATFGANAFADMSAEEFARTHLNGAAYYAKASAEKKKQMDSATRRVLGDAIADKIDWRLVPGVVGPVKNQGSCGSCWAFASTGNIEGVWAVSTGKPLTPLSEQELVSCDTTDSGCNGGLMDNAFKWLLENRGGEIVTEASLPYTSGNGFAPACPSSAQLDTLPVGAIITGHDHIDCNEDVLATWVNFFPIAVAIDATSFQTYTSGILTNCINQQINHAVLTVGYDDVNLPPYWIIKNSWGKAWGEEGYVRLIKGANQCMIGQYCATATVGNSTKL